MESSSKNIENQISLRLNEFIEWQEKNMRAIIDEGKERKRVEKKTMKYLEDKNTDQK